ncbi:hypothetical protein OSB04_012986 [Centaurea solstitialis]|uniref:Uncharacterized protein n=1 Tax=Centaurea solstitialis TaxID=347529 RepID=A0AA38TVF4_9ASTR|nr:hypothetical protein OSB04_012986 [Centaurea solstitialis]
MDGNGNRQMEVHYANTGFPYTATESFMDFFDGISHQPIHYAHSAPMHDQKISIRKPTGFDWIGLDCTVTIILPKQAIKPINLLFACIFSDALYMSHSAHICLARRSVCDTAIMVSASILYVMLILWLALYSAQENAYWSMNMSSYKYGLPAHGSIPYYDPYEVQNYVPRMDLNRSAWEYPVMMNVTEPASAEVQSAESSVPSMQAIPEECSPNHDSASSSQVVWQDDIDPDNMTYEELLDLGEAIGSESRGLSQELIDSLPTTRYKSGGFFLRKKSGESKYYDDDDDGNEKQAGGGRQWFKTVVWIGGRRWRFISMVVTDDSESGWFRTSDQ